MKPMIVHYEEYSVTSDGRVFSRNGRELKQRDNGHGYLQVQICGKAGKRKAYVHRLVAAAFLANEGGKRCANHKDGNKKNNNMMNLEWCTNKENTAHAAKTLHVMHQYEEANKKREKPVIGSLVISPTTEWRFKSIRAASEATGIAKSGIVSTLKGRQLTSGGMYWRYAEK